MGAISLTEEVISATIDSEIDSNKKRELDVPKNSSRSHKEEFSTFEDLVFVSNTNNTNKELAKDNTVLEDLIFIEEPNEDTEAQAVWQEWEMKETMEVSISSARSEIEWDIIEDLIPEEDLPL